MTALPGKREFLSQHTNPATGLPFAKFPSRGQFSKAALAFAAANADKWSEDAPAAPAKAPTVTTAPRPVPGPPAAAPAPVVRTPAPAGTVDLTEVRTWARANGYTVGDRGRVKQSIIDAFVKVDGAPTTPTASRPQAVRVKVRPETQAFGLYRRGPNDNPKIVSEPLLVLSSCGYCSDGISYCKCPGGPRLPLYAGGEVAVLDSKPVV